MDATDFVKLFLPMPNLPPVYQELALKAERDLLGLLMLWDDIDLLSEIEPSWFTTHQHFTIFRGMEISANISDRCELITLSETLEKTDKLAKAGGLIYLTDIAINCPHLTTWQIAPLLSGFSKMRYAMTPKSGERCIVKLEDALIHGWNHGKSWYSSGAQLKNYDAPIFLELQEDDSEWVCYAFVDESEIERLDIQ